MPQSDTLLEDVPKKVLDFFDSDVLQLFDSDWEALLSKQWDQPAVDVGKSYLHASVVVIGEAGVLISGPSGSGKSSLALALIAAAEGAGFFARLVGDDRIAIACKGTRLIARGHPLISERSKGAARDFSKSHFSPRPLCGL